MDGQVDLDVENLFNEDADLGEGALDAILPGANHPALQPQTVAPSAALVERIINLKYCGCLKRVAWGRQGHVTTISEDNSTITVQCLRLLPGTSTWQLTPAKALNQTFENAASLLWSPTGVDLAIVDTKSRVYFYSMTTTCLNRLNENKHSLTTPIEEQTQPILVFWLNQDRPDRGPRSVVLNVIRNGGQWTQNLGRAKSFAPQFQRAFVLVTKKGLLILTYQGLDGQFRRVTAQLSIMKGSYLAHGAVAATAEGNLLMALYSFEHKLSVHRIHIEWPAEWKVNPSDPAHPKITAELLNADVPMSQSSLDLGDVSIDQPYHSGTMMLTHLEILPTSDIEDSGQVQPQIWAVFASVDPSTSATDAGYLLSSVIMRWNTSPLQRKLNSLFEDMPTRSEIQSSGTNSLSFEKLPNTQFPQIITNLELVDNGQMLTITTIDGQVELWDPINMTPASFESDPNLVTSMTQSGFSFSPLTASVFVTLSPNAASSITLRADQTSTLGHALYLGQPCKGLDHTDPQQSAAATSLVLNFARSCYSSSSCDDVLASMFMAYQKDIPFSLIARMYETMFHVPEFTPEKAPNSQMERLGHKPLAQKALALHFALCSSVCQLPLQANGFPHPMTWCRLWAWVTLNLRYVSTSLVLLFKEIQASHQNAQAPPLAPSYIEMVCNMIKYTFDIYRFIFETIIEVGDRQTNPDLFDEPSHSEYYNLGDEKGDGSQGLVALLLNCTWSRGALLATVRPLLIFVGKADPSNPNVRQIVDAIRRYSSGKGLSLSAVEMLFNGRWYQRIGLAENEQFDSNVCAQRQITMMTTGVVGEHYQNTIRDVLKNIINSEKGLRSKASSEFSRLKLFTDTPDISWLLLNQDQYIPSPPGIKSSSLDARKLYDVHKKAPIVVQEQPSKVPSISATSAEANNANDEDGLQMIRRCTRCGSLSEDVSGTRHDWPKPLNTFHARCICDGYWVLEPLAAHRTEVAIPSSMRSSSPVVADGKLEEDPLKNPQ